MFTNSFKFYKTPLDNNYTNVIDFNNDDIFNIVEDNEKSLKDYLVTEIFDKYYSPLIIPSLLKASKSDLLTLEVTINKSYEEMIEYNYCITFSNFLITTPRFYFITNIISQNDNPANPSCTILLQYDVWNNNIYHLCKNQYYGKVLTRHYDRVAGLASGNLFYNNYSIINTKLDHTISNEYVGDVDDKTKSRYKVLFVVYEFNTPNLTDDSLPEVYVDAQIKSVGHNGRVNITKIYDYLVPIYNKNLMYIPIALLDTLNNEFVSATISGKGNEITDDISFFGVEKELANLVSFPLFSSLLPYTARIHLSYFSPYDYIVADFGDDKIIYFDCITSTILSDEGREYVCCSLTPKQVTFEGDFGPEPYNVGDFSVYNEYIDTIKENLYEVKENEYTIDIYKKLSVPTTRTEFINNGDDGVEPQKYSYPFNFLSLSINSNQYPLVLPDPKYHKVIIDEDYRGFQPRIILKDELGKKLFSPQGFYMESNGTLSFSIDALDDYLIRNGSQEKIAQKISDISSFTQGNVNIISSLMSALAGAITGNVSMGISGANSLLNLTEITNQPIYKSMMINAKHQDLANTPDTYNVNTGENDRLYQNRLQLYHYKVDEEDVNYENAMNNFHMYGYDIIKQEDISGVNNRINFDFIKCEYVDLPLNINSSYINILKNIFIKGVFKNHYNYNNGNIIFNSTFDKSIGNKERKFIFNERFRNWLNL